MEIFQPSLPFNSKLPFVLAVLAFTVINIFFGEASVKTKTFSGMLTVAGGNISNGR